VTARSLAAPLFLLIAAGCAKKGEIDLTGGVGITSVRSACPVVGVPAGTGDVTLFDPPASRDASAIDVVAAMSDVRSTCDDQGDDVITRVTFQVDARRTRTDAPRDVTLPYFIAITRGGSNVVAKRVGQVQLHFDAGQGRATASTEATTADRCGRHAAAGGARPADPQAQGGRRGCGGRSARQPRGARRGRLRHVRGAGGVPADPGPAQV
jgi:hypothetical protein